MNKIKLKYNNFTQSFKIIDCDNSNIMIGEYYYVPDRNLTIDEKIKSIEQQLQYLKEEKNNEIKNEYYIKFDELELKNENISILHRVKKSYSLFKWLLSKKYSRKNIIKKICNDMKISTLEYGKYLKA